MGTKRRYVVVIANDTQKEVETFDASNVFDIFLLRRTAMINWGLDTRYQTAQEIVEAAKDTKDIVGQSHTIKTLRR